MATDINHKNRLAAGVSYYPKLNQSLPEYFKLQDNGDGPVDRPISMFNNGTTEFPNMVVRPCEVLGEPDNSSKYPKVQDALSDFEPDQGLLGCAVTSQYHNSIHGNTGQFILDEDGELRAFGDMSNPNTAPLDPLFWRLHKFVSDISANRSLLEDFVPQAVSVTSTRDTKPPQVFSQNPFRVPHNPFITALPVISEEEKYLFGLTGVEVISVEFDEPVSGVLASNLIVNGSAARQINGEGEGPYVFIGFKSPEVGPVNVTLSPGSIKDGSGNRFEGTAWEYVMVKPNQDHDRDGLEDGLEVNLLLTSPVDADSDDDDDIPDGFEVLSSTSCLDPLQSNAHVMDMAGQIISDKGIDSDRDGVNDVQEFLDKTDPCLPTHLFQENLEDTDAISSDSRIVDVNTPIPFALIVKTKDNTDGISATLMYDSFTNRVVTNVNGNETRGEISDLEEEVVKRTLNISGFYDTDSFYPPAPNSTDFIEYTVIATVNGRLHAVYWTDNSESIPDGVRNIPHVLSYLLRP